MNFTISNTTAEKGQPFTVTLNVVNKSIFPCAKAEAVIEYQNIVNGDINEIELYFPIQSRNSQKVDFQLTSKFCGKIKIHSDFIAVYDPIRLFRAKTAHNIETEITVMPSYQELNGYILDSYYIDDESTKFSQVKPGDDPSEVFDFHEYHMGDKPSRIHWKLSSKKDEFIVKELSMPINEKIILFPDMRCYENSGYTLPIFDTIMESLMTISVFLIENEHPHYIISYDSKRKDFVNIYIDDIQILYEFILDSVNNADIKYNENPLKKFFDENPEILCSSFTCISHEADTETSELINKCVSSEIKNLVYVSGNGEEKDISDFDEINIVTVSAGRISSMNGIEL